MADLLESTLRGELEVSALLKWLKSKTDEVKTNYTNLPDQLKDASKLKSEFVPFFLNYLRDQTLPLLQNCKSVTPSPVKTPSSQKLKSRSGTPSSEGRQHGSAKRIQLFSPAERSDLSPICSLETSKDGSPRFPVTPTERNVKTFNPMDSDGKYKHRFSPRDNQPFTKSTVDPLKSKHKISLGDFLSSPDSQSNRKKKSPLVNIKKDKYKEDGQSPSPGTSRKWNTKKRQTTPEHYAGRVQDQSKDEDVKAKLFNLSNMDDFPSIGQAPQPQVMPKPTPAVIPVRRINPTPVKSDMKRPQNTAFLAAFTAWGASKESSNLSGLVHSAGDATRALDFERALLRKEKAKRLEEKESGLNQPSLNPVTPTKSLSIFNRARTQSDPVIAVRSEVTHEDKLVTLAEIYSSFINENLLPNLNVELYFLVQLLTIQEANPDTEAFSRDFDDINYFSTIHNAVFFSVKILERQQRLLCHLDLSTVRLLSDNPRVVNFSPHLAAQLSLVQDSLHDKTVTVFPKSPIGGVAFQTDTDNRENFPSQQSFLLFKKQRDQFYELIREWEESHMTPGWQMTEKLGIRIKSLVKSKTELANHIKLARLFQLQLLTMCKGDQSYKTEGDDEQVALLSQLKKSNPEKFKRLQERFVTPMTIGGPSPPPSFPGYQEFFKDFILAASCHTFNQHLTDTFTAQISQLDRLEITETDVETEEGGTKTVIDEEEREQFVTSLLSVRLVGKFLGFLTFLPYQTTERLPDSLLPSYLEIRATVALPLEVNQYLEKAFKEGRLVMTVPWVVEFLSMMDPLSPLLTYFNDLLQLLLQIYRFVLSKYQADQSSYNYLLLAFTLGWFFELPVLPDGFFFQSYLDLPGLTQESPQLLRLMDDSDLIDQQVLYSCCPYLVEIRSLLLEFSVGMSSRKATIRKITPVAADDIPTTTAAEKQLQLHMEENFFHNHPASLKRVVEFVGERTASNFIKRLRSSTLTKAFISAKEIVGKLVAGLSGISPNPRIKEKLSHDVSREAGGISERVRTEVTDTVHQYCHSKILEILPSLLPEEQMEAVVTMSVSISCRQAEERVMQWLNNHITTRIFQREMSEELEKMCRPVNLQKTVQSAPAWRNTGSIVTESQLMEAELHDDDMMGPTDVLTETKVYVRDVILYNEVPSLEGVTCCVKRVYDALSSRQDILPEAYRSFSQLLQDLALYVLCCRPGLWTDSVCSMCTTLWTSKLKEHTYFGSVMSPRLLHWMNKYLCRKVDRRPLSDFIGQLLEKDLLTSSQLNKSSVQVIPIAIKMGLFEDVSVMLIDILTSEEKPSEELEAYTDLIDCLHQNLASLEKTDLLKTLESLTSNTGQKNLPKSKSFELLMIADVLNTMKISSLHQENCSKDPGSHSEDSETCSKHTGSHSEDSETCSKHTGSRLEDSETFSKHTGSHSEDSETFSKHPGSRSDDSATYSKQPGSHSEDSETFSKHTGSRSEDSETCSKHTGTCSEDSETCSKQPGFCSEDSETCSKHTGSRSEDSETGSKHTGSRSEDSVTCSAIYDKHLPGKTVSESCLCSSQEYVLSADNVGCLKVQQNSTDTSKQELMAPAKSSKLDNDNSLQKESFLDPDIDCQKDSSSKNLGSSEHELLANEICGAVRSNCLEENKPLPNESGDNKNVINTYMCTGSNRQRLKSVGNNNMPIKQDCLYKQKNSEKSTVVL